MSAKSPKHLGPMGWMAGNSVAANLIMIVFLVGGLIMAGRIKQEIFPEFTMDTVTMTVSLPGASPEEVENSIILASEEAVQGLEGVKEITSTATEGLATVTVEALESADIIRLWQDIKSEIDRVDSFPDEAEEPNIAIDSHKRGVLSIALHGDESEALLREAAEEVRDELLQNPHITQVDLQGVRDYEIHIEIPKASLRRYGLTLGDVANTVSAASVELGGGNLKTESGDILLRMNDRRKTAREYGRIPLLTTTNGAQILLDDVARVSEGFEDTDAWADFDGQRAVMIEVYRVGDQTPIEVADAALEIVGRLNHTLPHGIHLSVVRDSSQIFRDRAELLLKNAYMGLALVFVLLALFLDTRLAFWVSLGIPISFLGSFLLLSTTDFSINMITMFAFIVTLGIVVDDAIIVGENVFSHRRMGKNSVQAAMDGVKEVAMPVVFSVLTNIVTFIPLYFVPGFMGKVFGIIPVVVTCVFLVSLIESLFVLPAHLAHSKTKPPPWPLNVVSRWQMKFSESFERFVRYRYAPFLDFTLQHRYSVLAIGLALLIGTLSFVGSGRMGLVLFPRTESDYAYAQAVLPAGASKHRLESVEKILVDAAEEVARENGGDKLSQGVFSQVNESTISVRLFLTPAGARPIGTTAVTNLWRSKVGALAGLESMTFEANRAGPGSGKNLTIRLSHRNEDTLEQAGADLARDLENFNNANDIDDGSASGKRQFDIQLLPAGERVGLTSQEVARQIRYAFYGAEAVKQQRGRNEVTVVVRLPEKERASETTIEDMILRAPDGEEIPLLDAAHITEAKSYTSITRTDGRRTIEVTANVEPPEQAEQVLASLVADALPRLTAKYPGLSYSFEGHQADMRDSVQSLMTGLLLSLLGIYALLAVPFKSYIQPLIIMFCIPFGIVGAVFGHLLLGYSLSLMSLFGLVALSGVVINDSLVLIDFANRRRKDVSAREAVEEAGAQRFRAIMLTTATTFGGLAPMIFETSRQARFLIPMALSLGFGILFTTVVTLVLVPSLYVILEDVWRLLFKAPPTDMAKDIHGVPHPVERRSEP
ncbi:MAG: hypothetical protein PWQ57_2135 [Desulfovibrionales bacterium]|nr:hypothetical protein [Desulfovibrionales bacterium]